jgi:hypothetical protein
MKTATEALQRHAPLSGCPAPPHLSASMRSLRSIAATQFRRSRVPWSVGRYSYGPAPAWSNSGNLGEIAASWSFLREEKKVADTTAPRRLFPIKPSQAQSSLVKVHQKDAQPRQRHDASQIPATADGTSDFSISAFQFSAFSPHSSPFKPNQGALKHLTHLEPRRQGGDKTRFDLSPRTVTRPLSYRLLTPTNAW